MRTAVTGRPMRARSCHVLQYDGQFGWIYARTCRLYLLHRQCLIFTLAFISCRTVTIIATDSTRAKGTPLFYRECNGILSYLQTCKNKYFKFRCTEQSFKILEEIVIDDVINSKHLYLLQGSRLPRSVISIEIHCHV